ncbi:MAG: hypothetical protein QM760_16140 [Nibricoccus sp.]
MIVHPSSSIGKFISGLRDARTQLLIYALGLMRSGKAGSGPERPWIESDIRTMEVQLLTGVVRRFTLDEAAIAEMEEYMFLACAQSPRPEAIRNGTRSIPSELTGILSEDGCTTCGFKPICWKEHHENR